MKKFMAISLVLMMLLAPTAYAGITTNTRTVASALAVGSGATVYSSVMAVQDLTGHLGILLVSTAGSITVTQQCSVDGATFYDPVDTDAAALGAVIATLTVTAGTYVIPKPVLAPFIRYKIVEGGVAPSAVTIKVISQRS